MAKFSLIATGNTDIQTTFRYQLVFPANDTLGITSNITAYCFSSQLPKAPGSVIPWYLPMGMKNHQAGRREIVPLQLQFVIPQQSGIVSDNVIDMFESWAGQEYDLNTGTSGGKATYAWDGIQIQLIGQDDIVKHMYTLYKAFPTDYDPGTVNSETNDLLKGSMSLVYDRYKYTPGY